MCFQRPRKLQNALPPTLTREDVCANIVSTPSLEIFDDRHPNGTDGFTLLTVLQSQATRLGVHLRPFQANHLATPAAGERNLADDVHDRGIPDPWRDCMDRKSRSI